MFWVLFNVCDAPPKGKLGQFTPPHYPKISLFCIPPALRHVPTLLSFLFQTDKILLAGKSRRDLLNFWTSNDGFIAKNQPDNEPRTVSIARRLYTVNQWFVEQNSSKIPEICRKRDIPHIVGRNSRRTLSNAYLCQQISVCSKRRLEQFSSCFHNPPPNITSHGENS